MIQHLQALFILLLVLLTSCASPRVVQEYSRDSIVVHVRDSIVFRDSIFYVGVEKEEHSAALSDTDTSRLSTRYAESEAYVSGGRLHHSLRNRSEALIPVEVKLPKVIHQEYSHIIREQREIVEVEKQMSRWQQFIQALGYVLIGGVVLWIALKLRKILM